jgi:hypothetical protein
MTTCAKCQGTMEQGYLPDYNGGTAPPLRWTPGNYAPKMGDIFTREQHEVGVTAERCTKCGYLELYARR